MPSTVHRKTTAWSPTVSSSATTLRSRRTASWGGRHVQPVHILARGGAHPRRTARRSSTYLRADARLRQPPRALRRGDRTPRRGVGQLPPSLHAPDSNQRRLQPRSGAREESLAACLQENPQRTPSDSYDGRYLAYGCTGRSSDSLRSAALARPRTYIASALRGT